MNQLLIEDMRIAMSYDIVSHEDLILVEIYKQPEFDGYFNGWFEDILSKRTRQLF